MVTLTQSMAVPEIRINRKNNKTV